MITDTQRPRRTCVGCREVATKSELLRVVADRSGLRSPIPLLLDHHQIAPGRGAYVHPTPECVERAQRRRALPRALRLAEPLDSAELTTYVATRPPTDQPRNWSKRS